MRQQWSYDTIDQLDLIGIYRTVHPKTAEYTFFSNAHGRPHARLQNKSQHV